MYTSVGTMYDVGTMYEFMYIFVSLCGSMIYKPCSCTVSVLLC